MVMEEYADMLNSPRYPLRFLYDHENFIFSTEHHLKARLKRSLFRRYVNLVH
jgi:hypothetical protein